MLPLLPGRGDMPQEGGERMREEIERIVAGIANGVIDPSVVEYRDYRAPHVVLKPSVRVTVELTEGKVITIDFTKIYGKSNVIK